MFGRFNAFDRIPRLVYSLCLLIFMILSGYSVWGPTDGGDPDRVWVMIPVSLAACLSLFYMFKELGDTKITNVLSYIGKYTMGIYLAHFLFVYNPNIALIENYVNGISFFFVVLGIAIIISMICILLQKLIEPMPLLKGLMYGKWNK